MLVYLDSCSIQRPLDDRSQLRIAVESECVLGVLALVESRAISLASSEVLLFEIENNTNTFRRTHALEVLAHASTFIEITPAVEERGLELEERGLKPMDALHVACAVAAGADYFCTCDDAILRKTGDMADLGTTVVTPVELVKELEQ